MQEVRADGCVRGMNHGELQEPMGVGTPIVISPCCNPAAQDGVCKVNCFWTVNCTLR